MAPLPWVDEVFAHHDIGPVFLAQARRLQQIAGLNRACRATKAVTDPILARARKIHAKPVFKQAPMAADLGDVRMLRWLKENDPSQMQRECVIVHAAGSGHVDALRFLKWCGAYIAFSAIIKATQNGRFHALKYLVGQRPLSDHSACIVIETAAEWGQERCLKYLLEKHRPELTAMIAAARKGNVACMAILHKAGAPATATAAHSAANYGQLEALKWLFKHGAPCKTTMIISAVPGSFECLKYVCEQQSGPKDVTELEMALRRAVEEKKIDSVKYLVTNMGAPIDTQTFHDACNTGLVEAVDFFAAQGRDITAQKHAHYLSRAVRVGDVAMVACLRRHGLPWDGALTYRLLKENNYGSLALALKFDAPVRWHAKFVACKRDLDIGAKILRTFGHSFDEFDGLLARVAVEHDSERVLHYLLTEGVRYYGKEWEVWAKQARERNVPYINKAHKLILEWQQPLTSPPGAP